MDRNTSKRLVEAFTAMMVVILLVTELAEAKDPDPKCVRTCETKCKGTTPPELIDACVDTCVRNDRLHAAANRHRLRLDQEAQPLFYCSLGCTEAICGELNSAEKIKGCVESCLEKCKIYDPKKY